SGDAFGYAVAISGATAVVSGHGNDDNGPQSGSAYVFTETSGTWSEQQKLLPLDGMASDSFGFSVGIEGETVIVGADLDDHGAEVDAGSAYVFTRSGLVWSEQQKLTADDYAGGDNFGWSVSVSGDMAVVGAVGDDYVNATYSGSAYEFKRNSQGTWAQVAKLVAPDRAGLDDKTGRAVAIEGDTAILGARDAETAGSASGAAYAFFLDADGDGVSDDLDAFPNDPSETVDSDGDGVGDNADAFPLDITEWLDTDSDGIGNNADLDDDGDVIPDVNDQGPLDAANCRVKELRVVLVWDVGTPFGLDHQRGPLGRHRYLRRELAELNGSNGYQLPGFASAELLATELETVATDLETLLNFQPMGLPINDNYVTVENCFGPSAAGCVPAQGPGSAAVLYVSDRAQLPTDPDPSVDFGPLEGVAWDGVERFARGCEGRRAVVLVTSSDLGDAEFPGLLVEKLAHELGHLYGLRHILTTDAASCTTPLTDAAVMDYVPDRAALFADCDSPGCAVVEPPVCDGSGSGQPTAGTHNPLYHFLHFALGHADDDLGALPIPLVDGSWDREEEPLLIWHIEFTFTCGLCDEPSSDVFYNVTFYEQLPDGSTVPIPLNEAGDTTLAEISLEELNELNFLLPASSALQLTFSSGDPNNGGPTEADVTFEFPFQPQEDGVVVTQNVELAKDENGTIVKDPVGNEATPTLEIQEDGTYLVGTDTLINSNTEVPPAVAVPEPHPVLQLFAGIVGLLALGRLRARKPRGPG
ncbi:MAG: hypothetical protein HRU01_24460, partial [Myxococcales bacterium]|nr:hypothetical protein [Myxococcales bacterium]